jgi:hypothetical protein
MYPFRIFISYSHEDRDLVKEVVRVLKSLKLEPVWDKDIRPGVPFTETIKGLIAHAHIFMPLITENSQSRPWVHQETGYAMALNIPVLPVAIGNLPGEMIAQLQAIKVESDLIDLKKRLLETNIERLVFPSPTTVHSGVVVAELPEKRTELIANYAIWLIEQGKFGKLRQRGALSSFCIPDVSIDDPIWRLRDGINPRSDYYHQLQREERRALELHARRSGCLLVIDPTIDFSTRGPKSTWARLSILLEFLKSITDDKVKVVMSRSAREESLTIVGDWFEAYSLVPRSEGYRQTVFSWHAPTVLNSIKKFDNHVSDLYEKSGMEANASRKTAIKTIEEIISGLT